MNYYLNIGSNIGNRQGNISQAIDLINSTFKTSVQCSSPVESEPWGFDSGNTFVNEGIVLRTDRAPHDVLTALQRVERSISDTSHRNADGSYRDRIIDIDIVAIDHLVIDSPTLKVPHPHFAERDFYRNLSIHFPCTIKFIFHILPNASLHQHQRHRLAPGRHLLRHDRKTPRPEADRGRQNEGRSGKKSRPAPLKAPALPHGGQPLAGKAGRGPSL